MSGRSIRPATQNGHEHPDEFLHGRRPLDRRDGADEPDDREGEVEVRLGLLLGRLLFPWLREGVAAGGL